MTCTGKHASLYDNLGCIDEEGKGKDGFNQRGARASRRFACNDDFILACWRSNSFLYPLFVYFLDLGKTDEIHEKFTETQGYLLLVYVLNVFFLSPTVMVEKQREV